MISRWVWFVMMIGIGIEFALGVVCLVLVPVRRPDQWLPPQSRGVYVAHAALGGLLAIGALTILIAVLDGSKFVRLGARIGLVGLILGAVGGTLTVSHPWRLTGMGLMFAGALLAFFGYVIPLADVPLQGPPG
jgi:hypothetical protein